MLASQLSQPASQLARMSQQLQLARAAPSVGSIVSRCRVAAQSELRLGEDTHSHPVDIREISSILAWEIGIFWKQLGNTTSLEGRLEWRRETVTSWQAGLAGASWPAGQACNSSCTFTAKQCTASVRTALHCSAVHYSALHCSEELQCVLHYTVVKCSTAGLPDFAVKYSRGKFVQQDNSVGASSTKLDNTFTFPPFRCLLPS